jgi:hypothetical protein
MVLSEAKTYHCFLFNDILVLAAVAKVPRLLFFSLLLLL